MSSKRRSLSVIGLISIFFLSLPVHSHDELFISQHQKNVILQELSGLKALDAIYGLCTFDRSGASKGLYDSQMWVFSKLKEWGIKDIALDPFPADGSKVYLDSFPAGFAWEKSRAVLSLVEPLQKKIIDYADIPTALIQYSNSADVTAELVDVGTGLKDADYLGKDVGGKIVFTSSSSSAIFQKAVKEKGACGIVSYWENYEPERSRFPDQVPWMSIPQELNTNHFGFAVSKNIAAELTGLLAKGKVVVRAEVKAENKIGKYHVLSSSIRGTEFPEKEIILTAHINHHKPGANDNASGCALLMEIERAMQSLIDSGRISPPKRTIRFVWIQEHTGTKVYLDSRPDLGEKGVLAINLDMVGENVLLCESSLRLVLGPHSCPSFLDDLMDYFLKDMAQSNITEPGGTKIPFTYALEKYNGAISDHYYYPSGKISIPTSFLYLSPDNYYHSNEDTPDKCDPTMLKRLGYVTMAVALLVASAGENEGLRMADLVYTESAKRLFQASHECLQAIRGAKSQDLHSVYRESVNKIQKTTEKEEKAIASVFRLGQTQKARDSINRLVPALRKASQLLTGMQDAAYADGCAQMGNKPKPIILTEKDKEFSRIIPLRKFRGPLNLVLAKKRMSEAKSKWFDDAEQKIPDFFLIRDEIINFVNNSNSIWDIRNAVSAEFYPIELGVIFSFLDGLREAGFLIFSPS